MEPLDLATRIAIGGGIAFLVFYLDQRRRKDATKSHKMIIKSNLARINEMVEYITVNINNIEQDVDGIPSKLNTYMSRHHEQMESLIHDMQIQHAQCGKLKPHEEETIMNAITSARWILDNYYRQDIPEPQRERVWMGPPDKLHDCAKTLIQAHGKI